MKKIQFIAWGALIAFSVTNTGWSSPASLALSGKIFSSAAVPEKIEVPADLGTVESQYRAAGDAPFIVILQDAHAIIDAQRQAQKLLGYFQKKYGIDLVALEGGEGPVDALLFRAFPDEMAKKKVMGDYLEKAEITGAQMAAVFGEREGRYYGIEDWDLYEENYLAYARAAEKKTGVLEKMREFQNSLDEERQRLFSPELNQLHERAEAFREEKINLPEFLKYLSGGSSPDGSYPHLEALMNSLAKEESFKKEDLAVSLRKMAEAFRKKARGRMDKKQEMEFNERFRAFQSGETDNGSFLKSLVERGASLGFKPRLTIPLRALLGNVQTLSAIKGSRLFEELENFIEERKGALVRSPEEKELVEKYRKLALLRSLASLEITHDQLAEYQKDPQGYLDLLSGPCVNCHPERPSARAAKRPSEGSREILTPALEFYRLALERDKSFRRNLKELLRKQKRKTVVVIAGGFHTRSFEENLKADGYSYAVIMPKINSLEGKDRYVDLMQGNLSYKNYLKTSFYDAFARAATVKLVGELSAPDFRRSLKVWRDEVIRELAKEGRLADAGRYTDYIDLLFKVYYDKFGDEKGGLSKEEILKAVEEELQKFRKQKVESLWQNFQGQLETFTRGLENLMDRKQVSLENLSGLLERASQSRVSGAAQLTVPNMSPHLRMSREFKEWMMRSEVREVSQDMPTVRAGEQRLQPEGMRISPLSLTAAMPVMPIQETPKDFGIPLLEGNDPARVKTVVALSAEVKPRSETRAVGDGQTKWEEVLAKGDSIGELRKALKGMKTGNQWQLDRMNQKFLSEFSKIRIWITNKKGEKVEWSFGPVNIKGGAEFQIKEGDVSIGIFSVRFKEKSGLGVVEDGVEIYSQENRKKGYAGILIEVLAAVVPDEIVKLAAINNEETLIHLTEKLGDLSAGIQAAMEAFKEKSPINYRNEQLRGITRSILLAKVYAKYPKRIPGGNVMSQTISGRLAAHFHNQGGVADIKMVVENNELLLYAAKIPGLLTAVRSEARAAKLDRKTFLERANALLKAPGKREDKIPEFEALILKGKKQRRLSHFVDVLEKKIREPRLFYHAANSPLNIKAWLTEALSWVPEPELFHSLMETWNSRINQPEVSFEELRKEIRDFLEVTANKETWKRSDALASRRKYLEEFQGKVLFEKLKQLFDAQRINFETISAPSDLKKGDLVQSQSRPEEIYIFEGLGKDLLPLPSGKRKQNAFVLSPLGSLSKPGVLFPRTFLSEGDWTRNYKKVVERSEVRAAEQPAGDIIGSTKPGLVPEKPAEDQDLDNAANEIIKNYFQHENDPEWPHARIVVRVLDAGAHFRVYAVSRKLENGSLKVFHDVFKVGRAGGAGAFADGGPVDLMRFVKHVGFAAAFTEEITHQIEFDKLPVFERDGEGRPRKYNVFRQERGVPLSGLFEKARTMPGRSMEERMKREAAMTRVFHNLLRLHNHLLTNLGIFVVDGTLGNAILTGNKKKGQRTKLSDFERAIEVDAAGNYKNGPQGPNLFTTRHARANFLNFFSMIGPILFNYNSPEPGQRETANILLREIKRLAEPEANRGPLPLAVFFNHLLREENRDKILRALLEFFNSEEQDRVDKAWDALEEPLWDEITQGVRGLIERQEASSQEGPPSIESRPKIPETEKARISRELQNFKNQFNRFVSNIKNQKQIDKAIKVELTKAKAALERAQIHLDKRNDLPAASKELGAFYGFLEKIVLEDKTQAEVTLPGKVKRSLNAWLNVYLDDFVEEKKIRQRIQSLINLSRSEARSEKDPEPQRDRPDVRILLERATDRSRVQRKQLSDSGFEIEEVVRKVLANDAIRIAVVPVGSTLKGYAGIGSDLDYLIYFLAGVSPDFKIEEKEAAKIFEEANKITAKNGPAGPDEKVDKVDEFSNYSGIAHHSLSAGEIAGLFFPVAYGDSALIEEARRQALRQVEAQSAPLDFWAYVQEAYTEAALFDPSSTKSNLFEWLGKHGLKAPMPWNPENLYGEDVKIQERQVRQYEEEARAIRARMAPETALPGFPEMLNAYGPPRSEMRSGNPISWLSRAILTVGQHDHRIEALNLENLSAELPKLKQMLRKEKNLAVGLEDRLTDQNSALDILLERIKDQIFTAPFGTQVNLVMISLPMVALNQISKDYLPGFADAFKKYFHRRLVQEYKMKAAFFGTRIVIANYDPLLAQDQLFSIIQKAAGDLESENESKIKRLSPDDLKSYKKMFNNALGRLFISHAPLYLENPPRENPMEDPLKPREVSPQEFETMPEEKRIEDVVDADEKLGQLREKWSLAASFWRAKISGAPSAEERAAARPKANFFIERLLQDVIARLYERGEVLEKAPADLRAEIDKLTDARGAGKKGVLPIFDQNVVRQLIAQIREKDNKENSGAPILPKFYAALQEGRKSAPPIFEYRKRGVVRMAGMPRRGHLLGNLNRISENLGQALKDLEKRPSEASLKRFKKIYRDYQFARYEALVLGYRDPRLEEYYKMDKIGEVARADELGLLDQLKERLAALSKRARKKAIRDRFQRLAGLIEPGLLPYKRPVGDEAWFAVKTGEKKHKIAFSELTQGRGFFVANPPDEQDSTYHEILLAQWESAKRHYAGWKTAKKQEPWWGFLKQFDDEILRLAPNLYPGIAKVPVKGVKERMTGFVKIGDTTSRFPDYARDERGQFWELNARKEWEKTNKIKPEDLKPFETLLTSARNYDDEEAGAAQIEAVSYKLDGLVGTQKESPDLIHEVLSAKELESKEKNASALKKPPRRSEARAADRPAAAVPGTRQAARAEARVKPKNKEELLQEIYAPLPEEDQQRLSKLHGEYIQHLDSERRFENGFWPFYEAGAFLSVFHHKGIKHVLKAFHPNFWRRDDIQDNIKNGLTIGKGIFSPYISVADAEIRKRILLPALDLETDKGWVIQEIAYPLDEYLSLLKRKWEAAEGVETKKDIEKTMRLIVKEWARLQYRSWAQGMILKDFGLENSGLTPEGEVLQIDNEFDRSRNDFFEDGTNSAEVINNSNLGMLKGIFGEENAAFVESFYGEGVKAEYFDILWPKSGAVAVKKEAPLFGVEGNPQSQEAAQRQFLEDFIRSVEVESSRSEARSVSGMLDTILAASKDPEWKWSELLKFERESDWLPEELKFFWRDLADVPRALLGFGLYTLNQGREARPEELALLEAVIQAYNDKKTKQPFMPLSLPLLLILGISPYVPSRQEDYVRLAQNLSKMPGDLKFRAAAADLLITGNHLSADFQPQDLPDLAAVMPSFELALQFLKNEISSQNNSEQYRKNFELGLTKFLLSIQSLLKNPDVTNLLEEYKKTIDAYALNPASYLGGVDGLLELIQTNKVFLADVMNRVISREMTRPLSSALGFRVAFTHYFLELEGWKLPSPLDEFLFNLENYQPQAEVLFQKLTDGMNSIGKYETLEGREAEFEKAVQTVLGFTYSAGRSEARVLAAKERSVKDAFDIAIKEQGGLDFSLKNMTDAVEMMDEIKKSAGETVDLNKIRGLLERRGVERRNESDAVLGLVIQRVLAEISGTETKKTFAENIFSNKEHDRLRGLIYEVLKTKNIPSDITLADSMIDVIRTVTAKGLVLGAGMAGQGVSGETLDISALTPEAKALLQDHEALQAAYGQFTKTNFKFGSSVILGTAFLKNRNLEEVQKNLQKIMAGGRDLILAYDSEMPQEVQLSRDLVKLALGASAVAYNDARPLTAAKIHRGGDIFALLLPTAPVTGALGEKLVYANEGPVRQLSDALGGMKSTLDAVELLLNRNILSLDKQGRRILDQTALNAFIQVMNQLAETRRVIQQAA